MSKSSDDILAQELGKLGELAGRLEAVLPGGSAGSKIVGMGGSFGAQFAAKFLPTETFTEKLALKIAPEKALRLGFSVLMKLGELQKSSDDNPPYPLLKAVVGSGFLNMNPAVVYLEILEGNATGC